MTKTNSKSARKALKNASKQPKNNTNAPDVLIEGEIEAVEAAAEVEFDAEPLAIAPEVDVDDLDAVLASMDQQAEDTSGALIVGDDADVEDMDKAEVYAGQESDIVVADGKQEKSGRTRQKTKKAEAGTPGVGRRKIDVTKLASILGTQEGADQLISGIHTLPKKVQDKATNALAAITSGGGLSTYTKRTVAKLAESGTISVAEIKAMMKDSGYSQGTANSQAQQQMVMLNFLGVASRAGSNLVYNAEHPLSVAIAA